MASDTASGTDIAITLAHTVELLHVERSINARFMGLARYQTYPWLAKLNESENRMELLKTVERRLKKALSYRSDLDD